MINKHHFRTVFLRKYSGYSKKNALVYPIKEIVVYIQNVDQVF